ncbi:MAG: CCA tRNA nucleotidyltransferase [Planctomycetes bacterium]|nr:CCA tRNA nucleotidyltransferase [Planctomycetota bacterium]
MSGSTTERRAWAIEIIRALRAAGHTAYLAGGCVRDELLGLNPKDFDIATDATPDRVHVLFPRSELVGAAFGVVIVKGRLGMIEVATFRADGHYADRRRPDSVTFSDAVTDAQRRDFTVNALFLDPLAPADPALTASLGIVPQGLVIDLVHGIPDLAAKVLRAVGDPDKRFAEDDLRVLRAVRFATRFGLAIEQATESAIRHHAGQLAGISRERVGDEMRRMLGSPSRLAAIALIEHLDLARPVLAAACIGSWSQHIPALNALPIDAPPMLTTAAWLLDRGLDPDYRTIHPDPTAALRDSWMLSNDEISDLRSSLTSLHTLETKWGGMGEAQRKRSAASAGFAWAKHLLRGRHPPLNTQISGEVAQLAARHGGLAPSPFITGDDLIRHGLRPGPRFKAILDQTYDAQLEGRVGDQSAALSFALALAQSNP